MTAEEITAYYSNMWNGPADLVLGRIAGNRSAYHVSDGNGNWAAVDHRWTGNGLEFQPRESQDHEQA